MRSSRLVKISKYLSRHLRHHPERLGLRLAPGGWVELKALLDACKRHDFPLTGRDVEGVVVDGDKPRLSLSMDGRHIRANYGHSAPVDLQYEPARPPSTLFHGTAQSSVASILAHGIKPMRRQYVHLSPDTKTARSVGRRRGTPAVLRVDSGGMFKDRYRFFNASGTWLTGEVPAKYIRPA
ncbi:MAG: RNA 2'-phosphotransferase [Elusimicrobiota bacterium]